MVSRYIAIGIGAWLVLDGVLSIYKYRQQSLAEHSIRVVRAVLGLALVFLSIYGD